MNKQEYLNIINEIDRLKEIKQQALEKEIQNILETYTCVVTMRKKLGDSKHFNLNIGLLGEVGFDFTFNAFSERNESVVKHNFSIRLDLTAHTAYDNWFFRFKQVDGNNSQIEFDKKRLGSKSFVKNFMLEYHTLLKDIENYSKEDMQVLAKSDNHDVRTFAENFVIGHAISCKEMSLPDFIKMNIEQNLLPYLQEIKNGIFIESNGGGARFSFRDEEDYLLSKNQLKFHLDKIEELINSKTKPNLYLKDLLHEHEKLRINHQLNDKLPINSTNNKRIKV